MPQAKCLSFFALLLVLVEKSSGQACNICNGINGFACFSQTQYVKCDDSGNVIGWSVTSCAAGLFCNNQLSSPVAADPCLRIAQPLAICQTPTIANPLDVRAFCQPRRIGRYSYSTGCKQYIYCYLFNAVKLGALYTCPGVTMFDNTVGACTLNAAFVCPV